MNNKTAVEQLILNLFPSAQIHVDDPLSDDQHLKVTVIEESFREMSSLQRHRTVMQALKERLASDLHAIELKLKPPFKNS